MSAILLVLKEFVTSKKFIAAVAGIVITLLAKLHFEIPESTVQEIVGLIIAYLLAQGWADKGKEAAKIEGTVALSDGLASGGSSTVPPQSVKDKLI